jgi:hypothetical protein
MSLIIPRKDVEDNPTPGMGNVYVEFYTLEEAKEARRVNFNFIYNPLAIVRKKI